MLAACGRIPGALNADNTCNNQDSSSFSIRIHSLDQTDRSDNRTFP